MIKHGLIKPSHIDPWFWSHGDGRINLQLSHGRWSPTVVMGSHGNQSNNSIQALPLTLKDSPGPMFQLWLILGTLRHLSNMFLCICICTCICMWVRKPQWVCFACTPAPWLLQQSCILKNGQIYTKDHSGCSVVKRLSVRTKVGEKQLRTWEKYTWERMGAWASMCAVEKGKAEIDWTYWWMGSRGHLACGLFGSLFLHVFP